jgi:hypothetical protein
MSLADPVATAALLPALSPTPAAAPATGGDPANTDLPVRAPAEAVLVGAGDIAGSWATDEATAALLDAISGTVFTLGDNAYGSGTAAEFAMYYEPTWGRHRSRTYPVPGNHDHGSRDALPYFDYFRTGNPVLEMLDPDRRGYYSYNLGGWHVISLDSGDGSRPQQAQLDWLRADLLAHKAPCMLAYWHHPRFSSGAQHGSNANMDDFWRILFANGVDVVMSGHDHVYERFDPQTPDGAPDATGIRAFTVGTGGAPLYTFGLVQANSVARGQGVYGVLKLTLHAASYEWEFLTIASQQDPHFTDSGTSSCTNNR